MTTRIGADAMSTQAGALDKTITDATQKTQSQANANANTNDGSFRGDRSIGDKPNKKLGAERTSVEDDQATTNSDIIDATKASPKGKKIKICEKFAAGITMLESEEELEELEDAIVASLEEAADRLEMAERVFGDDVKTLAENMLNTNEAILALGMLSLCEGITVTEAIVKHVDSKGKITRKKDRKTRSRLATQTTGLTKSKRRQIARKAAKTKRANPSINRRAQRKTKKALRKRKSMGL